MLAQQQQQQQQQPVQQQPNTPQLHYDQIDHEAELYPALEKFIKVREMPGLTNIDSVKRSIVAAISTALLDKELMQRIIDRSSKIATTATESLLKKDFALETDDHIMVTAAHNLVRYSLVFTIYSW